MNRYDEFREHILDLGYSSMSAAALQAAFDVDLFEAIGDDGVKSLPTIQTKVSADSRSLELLLNALASLNLVRKDGGGYSLPEASKRILLQKSDKYIGDMVKLQQSSLKSFLELSKSVRTGKPLEQFQGGLPNLPKEHMRGFIRAMHNTAMGHAELLARKLDLLKAETLLDIGGGPGTFSIHFLKQNPHLRVTIFDLPVVIEIAKEFATKHGVSERMDFQAGNFEADEIKGTFDVVFVSHIIHGLGEEANLNLFRKILRAIRPSGRLVIQDFFLNEDHMSPRFSTLFALNMLLHTDGGRTYGFDEVGQWLIDTGFSEVTKPILRLPRGISLLIGRK
ncbi:MAG: methyltransferase domain-containing protein [Candidatus Omnitrophica bacterium]|nr:methyltransferase domain-containing protein [Candidatus Omnitrophota bacterium]